MFRLLGGVQKYDWGKVGESSLVAQMQCDAVDGSDTYAELWMGTHPSCPSCVLVDGSKVKLQELLNQHPEYLGYTKAVPELPFLFKILSIAKALSIQIHPSKELAQHLHQQRPDVYKDNNHKPEMAIALTPFRGFLGFRPWSEVHGFLQAYAPLRHLVGESCIRETEHLLNDAQKIQKIFACLMRQGSESIKKACQSLVVQCEASSSRNEEEDLVLELSAQFPNDIGIFCVFLLNIVHLEPGQAVFLGAGHIHAYISGDIVECMATSDNVIRAGLTPKLRDVETLLSAVIYEPTLSANLTLHPQKCSFGSDNSKTFRPPVPEFAVTQISTQGNEKHDAIPTASILIVIEGKGTVSISDKNETIERGSIYFIAAHQSIIINTSNHLLAYRAFVPF